LTGKPGLGVRQVNQGGVATARMSVLQSRPKG
jgi:hypothetical protein